MSTQVNQTAPTHATDRRTHARRGAVLLAVAAWNLWVWGTRIVNMVQDAPAYTPAFVAVHLLLYGGSLALTVVLAVIGWRMRREARTPRPAEDEVVGA